MVRMNVGRNVDIHSNVYIRELSIHERTDAAATYPRREGACGYRNTISDFEDCVRVVQRAELRLLKNLGAVVGHEQRERTSRNGNGPTGSVQRTYADCRPTGGAARSGSCDRGQGRGGGHIGA